MPPGDRSDGQFMDGGERSISINSSAGQAAVAAKICASNPSWCVQVSQHIPTSFKSVLNLMLGMVAMGGGPTDSGSVDDPGWDAGFAGKVASLPERPGNQGTTSGWGIDSNGNTMFLDSTYATGKNFTIMARQRLAAAGVRFGGTSERATHPEQEYAAYLQANGLNGTFVINNVTGPCEARLGCNQVLNTILGSSKLTIYSPKPGGGWNFFNYGGAP